jgi:2-polyprenyl-3-methyl-5-hydroxy-6-metoxy-1,4-benzoquinol methylase
MSPVQGETAQGAEGRLAREILHHQLIAADAETVWNWESPAGRRRAARRAAMFVERCRLRPGVTALEVGCGTGLFLEQVARSGARIRGLDLSTDLLARARQRVAGLADVVLDCGNAQDMPYRNQSFDAVYGSSILHHVDPPSTLREAFRVLRPGGRLAFTEPNLLNPQIAYTFLVGPRRLFGLSPDEMAFTRFRAFRDASSAGFGEIAVRPFDFLHPAIPRPLIGVGQQMTRLLEALPLVREIAGSLLITAVKPATA